MGDQPDVPEDVRSAVDNFQATQDAKAMPDQLSAAVNDLFGNRQVGDQERARANAIESTPVATGGGGGYSFTPAQIEDMLQQCNAIIDSHTNRGLRDAWTIRRTWAPAPDPASTNHAQAVGDMGNLLVQSVQNEIAFVKHFKDQLTAVRQNYLDQEGNSVDTWKKLSGGLYT